MNKKKFQKLIYSPSELSDSELGQLEELQKDYPFSQVIHAVVAKSSLKKGTGNAKSKLGHAAIYSTNRKVLKNFIEANPEAKSAKPVTPVKSVVETSKKPVSKPIKKSVPEKKKPEPQKPVLKKESEKPKQQITAAKEAKLLKETPPNKQLQEKKSVEPLQKKPIQISPPKGSVKRTAPDEMDVLRNEVMSNLKELKSKIEKFEQDSVAEQKKSKSKKKSSPKKVKEEFPEANKPAENDLIDQINSMDEKEVGEKQKKQNKLIEEFVHRDPEKIKASELDSDKEVSDLARESVNFNEELVSENLAIIFAKQGKREKAIEIYKKLIWKYPQKKTYFATQIEDLEKN